MKSFSIAIALLLAAPLTFAASALAQPVETAETRLTSHIVGFYELPADLTPGAAYAGGAVTEVDEALQFAVVVTDDGAALEAVALQDARVRYFELNDPHFGITRLVPNDAKYNDPGHYGSKKIGAEAAWDKTLGSTSVKVAVIDSGLRKTHEEFAGQSRILAGYDTISEDNDPQDSCGHGTHVTGTIAATLNNGKGIAGMAQASIYPIRALTNNLLLLCSGSTADLAQALRLAGDQGAHFSSNSWGGGTSTSIADAIAYAHSKGTIQIAAAGNDGSCTNCVSEPWKSNGDKVIVVSSTDQNDALSSFSSQGPQVDVAAPGTSILSSYNGNDASYSTLSGTSMATPHVTGAAALVKTVNPTWGFADIDAHLKATAVDLGPSGKDDKFGYGRIDAAAAVGGSTTPTNEAPTASFTFTTSELALSVDGSGSSDADGSIASYSWNWGDGTAAGSGTTASHTYAAAGTYTVTLTVTDNQGAIGTTSKSVTVSSSTDPDPSAATLENGVAQSAKSGGKGTWQYYKISVPSGKSKLDVMLDGPACGLLGCSVDLDLYTKRGAKPTDTSYDCRPYKSGSDETCTHTSPAADWWYIGVKVYSGSSADYTIKATYS